MPLNPDLYARLVQYFGDVDIVAEGQSISWSTISRPVPGRQDRLARHITNSGEEYRVRCKVCLDHRARLHINHRWGAWDAETDSRNLHLIQCFNEQCYDKYDAQYRLYEILFENYTSKKSIILPGKPAQDRVLQNIDPPGQVFRLDVLNQRMPGHPALRYLQNRGFDTDVLARVYNVGWCANSRFPQANNRIIIPFRQDGMDVGWQARYIGDDVNGVSFNKAKVAKYWSSPGLVRRLVAYNLELALTHKTVVVVEGPADVWRQGPMCLGAVGKTLSELIRSRIVDAMNRHEDSVLVIALDPKQDERDIAKGRPHQIERLYGEIAPDLKYRVVRLYLPPDEDPGSIERKWFRELARQEASKAGLRITFAKPN